MDAKTAWESESHWICLNHAPPARLPTAANSCWMVGCGCGRPEIPEVFPVRTRVRPKPMARFFRHPTADLEPPRESRLQKRQRLLAEKNRSKVARAQIRVTVPISAPKSQQDDAGCCALEGCGQSTRGGSKYCSRTCSNRNARRRYKKKKRMENRQAIADAA